MKTSRLEAFTDAVIAIIMTLMVLELIPSEHAEINIEYLKEQVPTFVAMLLSFITIAVYWNNHHHLLNAADQINGKTLWYNMHLLFWIALIPITTVMIGNHYDEKLSVLIYGIVMLMCAVAYFLLQKNLRSLHDKNHAINQKIGTDKKGLVTVAILSLSILAVAVNTFISLIGYVIVLAIWIKPDGRLESK